MRSNLPNRRMLGNFNLPNRRLQLGDWQTDVVDIDLDPAQLAAFLARHPDVKQTVELFESMVTRFGYYQGKLGFPIPEWGMAVPDSVFQNVSIFPDEDGRLQYTGKIPASIAHQINLPPYVSPPGDGPIPWTALLWIAGGLLGVSLFNTVRGR